MNSVFWVGIVSLIAIIILMIFSCFMMIKSGKFADEILRDITIKKLTDENEKE